MRGGCAPQPGDGAPEDAPPIASHSVPALPVPATGSLDLFFDENLDYARRLLPLALTTVLEEQGGVIPGFAARHGELLRQLNLAAAKEGLTPIEDEALLDEVTALVERPNVLPCRFEPEFLAVPQECLILTMKANQKYFPLLGADGRLTHKFLVVSNIRPADASRVVGGNERVVRPRLADAKFFFDQDRKKTLESRLPLLDKVVYHARLGSMGERVARVREIADKLAISESDLYRKQRIAVEEVARQLALMEDSERR